MRIREMNRGCSGEAGSVPRTIVKTVAGDSSSNGTSSSAGFEAVAGDRFHDSQRDVSSAGVVSRLLHGDHANGRDRPRPAAVTLRSGSVHTPQHLDPFGLASRLGRPNPRAGLDRPFCPVAARGDHGLGAGRVSNAGGVGGILEVETKVLSRDTVPVRFHSPHAGPRSVGRMEADVASLFKPVYTKLDPETGTRVKRNTRK